MDKAIASPSTAASENAPRPTWRQKMAFRLGIGVWRADQQFEGYLFLLPSLIGFGLFVLLPILISLALSFQSWDLLSPPQFIGVKNYLDLFTTDPVFGAVLKNTFWYTVLIVPGQLAVGLVLALALNNRLRALRFYRLLYFMPYVASLVAAAIVFRFLFNQQSGIVAAWVWQVKGFLLGLDIVKNSPQLLQTVTDIKPPDFINGAGQGVWPGWAIISVSVFTIWKNVGATMIIYLAALQAVPEPLYDAAKVDGATRWARLRFITIPMISATTFFLLIVQMIGAFQLFDEPFIMAASSQNSVALASESLVMYVYRNAFGFGHMGKAAAISWVLFAVVFAATIIQSRLQRRWVYYETE
jgi:multiple sugar transport system permease protein